MTTWNFNSQTQAQLKKHTQMIYYSSQLIEMDQQLNSRNETISDDIRTSRTIARMEEVINAQTSPVCLVVTGDHLGIDISIN